MAIDNDKLNAFMGSFVQDLGAVMHAATIVLGDELGLYEALADGPLTAEALAEKTDTDARCVREWLSSQAASKYVQYDLTDNQFSLSEEQAFALAVEGSPGLHPRGIPDRGGAVQGNTQVGGSVQNRQRLGLARTRCCAVPRH
jgi:hypothetical protein